MIVDPVTRAIDRLLERAVAYPFRLDTSFKMIAVQFSKYCGFSHRRQTSQAPSGTTFKESYGLQQANNSNDKPFYLPS